MSVRLLERKQRAVLVPTVPWLGIEYARACVRITEGPVLWGNSFKLNTQLAP